MFQNHCTSDGKRSNRRLYAKCAHSRGATIRSGRLKFWVGRGAAFREHNTYTNTQIPFLIRDEQTPKPRSKTRLWRFFFFFKNDFNPTSRTSSDGSSPATQVTMRRRYIAYSEISKAQMELRDQPTQRITFCIYVNA
jgi:hypothetical protein